MSIKDIKLYSIVDIVANQYIHTYSAHSDEHALKVLKLVLQSNTQLSKEILTNPDDYVLYSLDINNVNSICTEFSTVILGADDD